METVFFEHLIHLDSEKFQSLNADSDVAPPKPTGILQVAGGQVLKLMRPLLHIQVFTGLAEELKSNTVEDQFSPPITFYNNEVALETKDPIGITKIVTPGQFDNSNTDLTPTVANTVNANTASTAGDKGFWDFIFGSNEPKKLVDYLIGAVSYEKIASSGKSSPKVLSPSLMSVNPENDQEKSGRLLLSPSLFSLHNRSDSLINIPEVLRESPELYGLVKAVVEEIMLNRNQHLAEAEATKRPTNRRITNELEEKEDIPAASSNKGKLSWLRFDPVNITNDDILVVENFHNKWKSNATLREEWRNWYKHNRNLTDVELDKLMRLNASASSFDQVLHDAVINMPFILTPENASSPGILSPVIASVI